MYQFSISDLYQFTSSGNTSHNTQSWKFQAREDAIAILPDYSRRCAVVDPDDGHLFKSLGCAAENLAHAAAAQGYASEIRYDADEDAVIVRLARSAPLGATALSHAITKRQCTKLPYDGRQRIEASCAPTSWDALLAPTPLSRRILRA